MNVHRLVRGSAGLLALVLAVSPSLAQTGDGGDSSAHPIRGVEYVYLTNRGKPGVYGTTVSAFERDAVSGVLRKIEGSPFQSGGEMPNDVVVDRSNRAAYVLNTQSGTIGAFKIDRQTGALRPIAGSPFRVGFDPRCLVIDPANRFLYVSDIDFEIHAFRIDPATGRLFPVAGSPFPGGSYNNGMVVAPSGRFLYTASPYDEELEPNGSILVHEIDPVTGALMQVGGPVPSGRFTFHVALHPSGRYLYATNRFSNTVSAFAIDEASGALTPLPGSPFKAGQGPSALVLAPTGKLLYVANNGSGDVSVFEVDPHRGTLAAAPGSPWAVGPLPVDMALDHSGRFLQVSHTYPHDRVSAYTVDPVRGSLRAVAGSPFPAQEGGVLALATTSFLRVPKTDQ
jgi:6-phosphogluconolactonase